MACRRYPIHSTILLLRVGFFFLSPLILQLVTIRIIKDRLVPYHHIVAPPPPPLPSPVNYSPRFWLTVPWCEAFPCCLSAFLCPPFHPPFRHPLFPPCVPHPSLSRRQIFETSTGTLVTFFLLRGKEREIFFMVGFSFPRLQHFSSWERREGHTIGDSKGGPFSFCALLLPT